MSMLIYLASPYTHPDPAMQAKRFFQTREFLSIHLKKGLTIFSPIVYCHELAITYKFPTDAEFWERFNFTFLDRANELWCLRLPGWSESKGMEAEMKRFFHSEQGTLMVRYSERNGKGYKWDVYTKIG